MSDQDGIHVAILIVGFRNPEDICACLTALSRATTEPSFDIFICENGGIKSFHELCKALADASGPCSVVTANLLNPLIAPSKRLIDLKCFSLKDRPSQVWIGRAGENLGYAGGINAWIERLRDFPCEGIWILNPDCKPETGALDALVRRAVAGNKGMVGSTILSFTDRNHIYCRAGHHWRKLLTSFAIIGRGDPVDDPIDIDAIEGVLDCISGASMYVTRACLEKIGPMDERFFLYYEDADWSFRAKGYGLGYARDSIVPHQGGTTIGSARHRAKRSQLAVYLESRNRMLFVRLHLLRFVPLTLILGFLSALEYLLVGSPRNFIAAMDGLMAALKGETGRPLNFDNEDSVTPSLSQKGN